MKQVFALSFLLLIFACEKQHYNDLLPDRQVDVTINLNLPQYINLQAIGGNAETPSTDEYGFRGIFIIRRTQDHYTAFERACPHLPLSECSTMTFDGLYFKCSCDNSKFSSYDGSSDDTPYTAREYHVEKIGSNLRITNY